MVSCLKFLLLKLKPLGRPLLADTLAQGSGRGEHLCYHIQYKAAFEGPGPDHRSEDKILMTDILCLSFSLLSLGRYCWGRSTTPPLTGGPLVSFCMRCLLVNLLSMAKMKRNFSSLSVWITHSTLAGLTRMQRTFW